MDFEEADRISATSNQFISDLLPTHAIYLDLLPESARAVVGVAHPEGQSARRLLEAEGFRYRGLVDVFDAGPILTAKKSRIDTYRRSRSATVRVGELAGTAPTTAFVATDRLPDFRVCSCPVAWVDDEAHIGDEAARALGLNTGERARIWTAT